MLLKFFSTYWTDFQAMQTVVSVKPAEVRLSIKSIQAAFAFVPAEAGSITHLLHVTHIINS